ncbi:MAG TPA: Mov34/MPN/PAD-1 family protein [Pseudoneobacillus sp.]|nr:Mov34/MPN/PAD-1 family protein [Pseudoneobacillus sp.]
MLYIYDTVLALVKKEIGDQYPERGGALLGVPGEPIVTEFIYDDAAETTSSSYSPSRELNRLVRNAEEENGLEFKGIIHSHPGSYNQPSYQDISELETGLDLNPHMSCYLVPIVTCEHHGELESHELILGEMKVSCYAGFLTTESTVRVEKMDVKVVSYGLFQKDLESLCESISGLRNPQVYCINHDGQPLLAGKVEVEELFDLLLLLDVSYPRCQSRILVTHMDGEQEECFLDGFEEGALLIELEKFVLSKIDLATI